MSPFYLQSNRTTIQWKPTNGYVLTNHVISQHTVRSLAECAVYCGRNMDCDSFNFKKRSTDQSGVLNCELNIEGRYLHESDFQARAHWKYYEMK